MGNESAKSELPAGAASKGDARDGYLQQSQREHLLKTFESVAIDAHGARVEVLTKDNFQRLMPALPKLAERLFDYMVTASVKHEETTLSKEEFAGQGDTALDMTIPSYQNSYFFRVFSGHKPYLDRKDALCLLRSCYQAYVVSSKKSIKMTQESDVDEEKMFSAMIRSLFGKEEEINQADYCSWIGRQFPRLSLPLHPIVCDALLGRLLSKHNSKDGTLHSSDDASWAGGSRMSEPVLWALHSTVPLVYHSGDDLDTAPNATNSNAWQLLYDSNSQGLSLNRFQHHVLCYKAPTLMCLRFGEHMYCIGCDQEWTEKIDRWGGGDCFLLHVWPEFRLMQSGSGMLYMNIKDRKFPKGIHIGKDARTSFLQIDTDFNKVKHYGIEETIERIEVWGCGKKAALEEQMRQQGWERSQAERENNRKLKVDDWKDNPDRQLLNLGGVQTEHAQR